MRLSNSVPLVKKLLQAGADCDYSIEPGTFTLPGYTDPISSRLTPLMISAMLGHGDVVDALLDHGADIDAHDDKGWTPLIFAVARKRIDVVAKLIDRGADMDARNSDGYTALMFAVTGGHEQTVRLLAERGADVDKPFEHLTPLKVIRCLKKSVTPQGRGRCEQIEALLVQYGAKAAPPQSAPEKTIDRQKFRITADATAQAVAKQVLARGAGKAALIELIPPLNLSSLKHTTGMGTDSIHIKGIVICECDEAFPFRHDFEGGHGGGPLRCLLCGNEYTLVTTVDQARNGFFLGVIPNSSHPTGLSISEITLVDEGERRRGAARTQTYLAERPRRLAEARRRASARKNSGNAKPVRSATSVPAKSERASGELVIDLRSAQERSIAQKAASPVKGNDEQLARQLVLLIKRGYEEYSAKQSDALERTDAEIKKIGEHLYANGGHEHMQAVYYRVTALGGNGRLLDQYWDGIGQWQM